MNEPRSEREFQRYLVMAINAERAAQSLTIKGLAEAAGINERTMLRIVHLERSMDMGQVSALADALGIPVSRLAMEAERRLSEATPAERAAGLVESDVTLTRGQKVALMGDQHAKTSDVRSSDEPPKRRGLA
jgi:transcriptional regulator with XRE-family HTH domain